MRQITDVKRNKRTFNLTLVELRKGDWIKEIPNSDLVEISYKNGYLTISDCLISKLDRTPLDKTQRPEKGLMEED
jgi:hypothetical protein